MNKTIAIITARGGSKRIHRKNIKDFFGQPMIKYAIDAALKSKIFDTVMVSTDDEEIAEISKKCGAEIPFMRSEETSNDFATTNDVLIEVIKKYKEKDVIFDNICCIYPCVPLLKDDVLKDAYNTFININSDALMPVVKYSYPIQRALRISNNNFLNYAYPENKLKRSQDLETMYHDVGMFYFIKASVFLKVKTLLPLKTSSFIMNELYVQDIDTIDDWNIAELKYKLLQNQ